MKRILLLFIIISCNMHLNAQWFWQNPLPQGNILLSVYFTDNQTGWAVGDNGTILKTTNGGESWINQSSGTYSGFESIRFTDNQIGWVMGGVGTTLKTTNGGLNWFLQSSGTSNNLQSAYFTDNRTGWAVGSGGTILKTTNGGVTFVEEEDNNFAQTKEFLLQQNYPNPFNPATVISYSVVENSFISLKVFDVLGREITELVNELKEPGIYSVSFDASQLSSGIYFYTLKANSYSLTKKMLLAK